MAQGDAASLRSGEAPILRCGQAGLCLGLVEKSINRTMNERAEMNLIYSRAVDGETSASKAIEELYLFDDPIARMDFIPTLERIKAAGLWR